MGEVADQCLCHRRLAFVAHLHQVDAAARRIHLFVPEQVSGARRQAETAMHAFVDERGGGRIVLVEGAGAAVIAGARIVRRCFSGV